MEIVRIKCSFNNCFGVKCVGEGTKRARGLALLWKKTMKITITYYSHHHIRAYFEDEVSGEKVSLIGVYGYPKDHIKKDTWHLIRSLRPSEGMWLCLGDFNDMVSLADKI